MNTSRYRIAAALAAGLVLVSAAPRPAAARPAHRSVRWYRAGRARPYAATSRATIWRSGAGYGRQAASVARALSAPAGPAIGELRGLWVVRTDLTSPARISHIVEAAKAFGYNALFVQVRGRGDAWYNKNALEPRAEALSNQPASFDPLQDVINKAHADGIQVHAWLNTCYVWSDPRRPRDPSHIVNAHPDWLAGDAAGHAHLTSSPQCEGAFLSPSNLQVRQHLHDVYCGIARDYDVDGIHFDYIRYPNSGYDHSPAALAAFAAAVRPGLDPATAARLDAGGPRAYLAAHPEQWAAWRRGEVTSLVQWIARDVKAAKPWVCISAAVFANWSDAYVNRGQDWHEWLRDGALDAVVPMAYGADTALVAGQIRDAERVARANHRACYAGLGAWHISEASTLHKIAASRADGAQGVVLFSYGGVTRDGTTNAYIARVDAAAFRRPAHVPQIASVARRGSVATASVPAATPDPALALPAQPAPATTPAQAGS